MSQLGEQLRAVRESQGISLSQAAVETRILQRYLVALEDGDYQHLPGDVYARGFIRNYAEYLGLSPEELMELYRQERGVTDPIQVVPATSAPRIRGFSIPSFFSVFFVALALVGVTYLLLNLTGNLDTDSAVADRPTPPAATPEPLPTATLEPTSETTLAEDSTTPEPSNGAAGVTIRPTNQTEVTPTPEAPIVGEIRIDDGNNPGSWVSVTLDGDTDFQGTLTSNESRSFTAENNVSILVGNAGVVSIVINGEDSGPLGRAGEVVTFTWP
ncbi:MAG: RodZ domain-containing protein [Chloroflexota bacterium]